MSRELRVGARPRRRRLFSEDELPPISGWAAYSRIDEIKEELAERLGVSIDVADLEALDEVARKFILPETIYVA